MVKTVLLRYMLTIAILFISIPVHAESFWGPTDIGMSPAKILKIVDGARQTENGSTLASGAKELVIVNDYRLVNESFKVGFYFIDNKLQQVTLKPKKNLPFSGCKLIYDKLSKALISKYGKVASEKADTNSPVKMINTNWVSGKMNINILIIAITGSPVIFNLNYQIRRSE